ncbi:MAG: Gfo/Idh/MocA family oxidoreductase [Clostridia bacterium]|nr:Gfo/Idh/MocA family oxidoreductase [Clostridia bacterium]
MEKMKAALVGAGNRGCVYADYCFDEPNELEIVAVVEPNEIRREAARTRYGLPKTASFETLDGFLRKKIACDFVINATMDEQHYETAKAIMEAGYDMLLEKPITANKAELLDLQRIAKERNLKVNVCHVLRYTPYYKRIKTLINEGKIGKILTIEMNEHVGIAHFLDSFVRGKWNSEARCGSSFLLQKSCHDMDLLCWLNNSATPTRVFSFGKRAWFIKENAPEGATEFCYNCPHNETCLYSAQKVHLEFDPMPFQTWMDMGKPIDQITKEEKAEWLKTSDYGRCAYNSGGDIMDRQTVNVEFSDGTTGVFTMVGGICRAGRYLHICGTKGEIEGNIEDEKFILRIFDRSEGKFDFDEEVIDVSKEIRDSTDYGGHGGGDYAIMYELVRYLNGDNSSISITGIDDSINGHLVVYAADESRKTGVVRKVCD